MSEMNRSNFRHFLFNMDTFILLEFYLTRILSYYNLSYHAAYDSCNTQWQQRSFQITVN